MNKLTRLAVAAAFTTLLLPLSAHAQSRTFVVSVTNLTQSQIISPPLAVVHDRRVELFEVGTEASDSLALMAEDGNPVPLADDMLASSHVFDAAAAAGGVMPGATVEITVQVAHPYNFISVVGMLVTTNDAFFGVQSIPAPRDRGPISVRAPAYDAGSEVDNESCDFIPGPPCGSGGVRDTVGAEGFIHIHSGIQGHGDLDAGTWDFNNPVARVTVRRAG